MHHARARAAPPAVAHTYTTRAAARHPLRPRCKHCTGRQHAERARRSVADPRPVDASPENPGAQCTPPRMPRARRAARRGRSSGPGVLPNTTSKRIEHSAARGLGPLASMAAGAGDHLMLSRLGLGEDNAEKAGSSTLLLHENVVSFRHLRCPPISAPGARACLLGHWRQLSSHLARDTSAARWAVALAHRPPTCSARR